MSEPCLEPCPAHLCMEMTKVGTCRHEAATLRATITTLTADLSTARDDLAHGARVCAELAKERDESDAVRSRLSDDFLDLAQRIHTLAEECAGPRPIAATPAEDIAAIEGEVMGVAEIKGAQLTADDVALLKLIRTDIDGGDLVDQNVVERCVALLERLIAIHAHEEEP